MSRSCLLTTSVVICSFISASANAALIGHYLLDDSSTPTVTASVGPNGTYENFLNSDLGKAPAPAVGSGTSVDFRNAGAPFQGINLGNALVGGQTELSMAMWVRMDKLNDDNTFASIGNFGGGAPLIFWRDDVDAGAGKTNTIAVLAGPNRTAGDVDVLNDTNWHHVAFTYQANTTDGLRLYVDGVQSGPAVTTTTATFPASASDLKLGIPSVSPSASKQFDGNMDNVSIWSNALRASEVNYLANGGSTTILANTTMTMLTPDADAYVQGNNSATINFGASSELRVKYESDGANFNRKSYIRFDVSGVSGSNIEVAELQLTLLDPVSTLGTNSDNLDWTFNVYGLDDGANDLWAENGINWNNAPGNDTSSGEALTDASLLGTFGLTGRGADGQVVSVFGQALVDFLNADTNGLATFVVTRVEQQPNGNNTVVHIFSSKEGANGPLLILKTSEIVPEPATLSLLTLAAAGMLGRRRRAA